MKNILIFTGGEYPKPDECSYVSDNSFDFVLCADSGLDVFECYRKHFGEKKFSFPQVIIGDMDSVSDKTLIDKYKSSVLKKFSHYKDYSDTELALAEAANVFPGEKKNIVLLGASGGRLDHFLHVYSIFSRELHPDVWLAPGMKSFVLGKNDSCRISGLSPDDRVSFLDLQCGCLSVRSEGLEWEGDKFMPGLVPSLSNRVSDRNFNDSRPVELTVESGRCLVCLPYNSVFEMFQ